MIVLQGGNCDLVFYFTGKIYYDLSFSRRYFWKFIFIYSIFQRSSSKMIINFFLVMFIFELIYEGYSMKRGMQMSKFYEYVYIAINSSGESFRKKFTNYLRGGMSEKTRFFW